jgi:hypothetical protein
LCYPSGLAPLLLRTLRTVQQVQGHLFGDPEAGIRPLPDGLPESDLRLPARRDEPAGFRTSSCRRGLLAPVGHVGNGVPVRPLPGSDGGSSRSAGGFYEVQVLSQVGLLSTSLRHDINDINDGTPSGSRPFVVFVVCVVGVHAKNHRSTGRPPVGSTSRRIRPDFSSRSRARFTRSDFWLRPK